MLAIIYAIKHFRPYIYGNKFEIRTDHKPLLWLRQKNDLNRKLLRWKLELEEFEFDIKYKKGTTNSNADSLSRIEPAINANVSESLMTQHSSNTDDNDYIPSTERPINEFRNQIILKQTNESSTETIKQFPKYSKIIIKKPSFTTENLVQIIQKYAAPNCLNGIYCDKNILKMLHEGLFLSQFTLCTSK